MTTKIDWMAVSIPINLPTSCLTIALLARKISGEDLGKSYRTSNRITKRQDLRKNARIKTINDT
jgi:hypothetical protein